MSSTMAGPMRWSAPAGATIRNCRPPFPSRPRPGPRLLHRTRPAGQSPAQSALAEGLEGTVETPRRLLRACHLCLGRRNAGFRGRGLPPPYRPAVPFPQRRLTARMPTSSETLASRKRKALKKERRAALGKRHRDRLADRKGPDRKSLGPVLRLLHGHRLAANGAGPISTASSIA